MTMANVIDISEYQDPAKFDYQAAKSNGIKAVIIRLSVGNRRDNHAAEHIANCKKYGLKWHGYHYWYNLSGEAAFAVSDAQSLGLTSSQYFFLDMEDKSLSSDWSVQFESFRSAVGSKYKIGLYCSDSPYKSHFDNAKMVSEGVYRWIAAYSYEPANYDTWQMSGEGSGGFGSYTGDVDRDYDKTGNLFKEETQPITPSTTPLYRQIIGEAGYDTDSGIYGLGRSYDNGKTFHVMDTVYGRIYRQQDGDSIWPFLQPKVGTIKGEKGDKGDKGEQGNVGPTPTLEIGTVTKLGPDQAPTANLSGGNGAYTLDLGIPQGETNATATNALNLANSVDSKVTDIQANGGGRNLLVGTSGDWVTKTASGWMNVTTADSTKTSVADYHAGDKFTYSATVTNKSNTNVRLELYRCDFNGNRITTGTGFYSVSDLVAPNTNAKRISCTITIDSNTWYVEHTLIADGGTSDSKTVQIKGEMFEKSTVAHDWSPAPEDIQAEIDANSALIKSNTTEIGNAKTAAANAQSSANSAQNTANTAKSTADSALSKANSNATMLNSKVNKSDLTWANISGKPSIPSTFNGSITDTSTDFNNLTSEGHYDIRFSPSYQGKNGPKDGNWGLLDVKVAGRMIVQTYYGDVYANVYVRNRRDGTWSGWRWVTFWPS